MRIASFLRVYWPQTLSSLARDASGFFLSGFSFGSTRRKITKNSLYPVLAKLPQTTSTLRSCLESAWIRSMISSRCCDSVAPCSSGRVVEIAAVNSPPSFPVFLRGRSKKTSFGVEPGLKLMRHLTGSKAYYCITMLNRFYWRLRIEGVYFLLQKNSKICFEDTW